MSENAAFDPKNHVVLGYWPENGGYAALMLNDAKLVRFVAAYGYDPDTREWAQGHYCDTAAEAWNMADPDHIEPGLTIDKAKEILGRFIQDEIPDGFAKAFFEQVDIAYHWHEFNITEPLDGWGDPDTLQEGIEEEWESWQDEHGLPIEED